MFYGLGEDEEIGARQRALLEELRQREEAKQKLIKTGLLALAGAAFYYFVIHKKKGRQGEIPRDDVGDRPTGRYKRP